MRTLIRSRIWLLLLLACAPSDQGAGTESSPGIQHPRPEYLAYRNLRTISAHVNDSSTPMLTAELSALRNAPSQLTIGGNQDTPFDDIRELVPLPRGELLVTDNAATAIHLLGANGKLARVGGSGEGPGEFQRATSAAPLPGGRLVIADVRRRLEQFSLHNGAATYSESFRMPFSVLGMCSIGDQVFAWSAPTVTSSTPIRVLDSRMEVVDSFGEAYESPNPLVNSMFAEVALVCDELTGSVVVAPKAGIGEVYIIDRGGTPHFKIRLEDYLNREILEYPDGSGSVGMNQAGVNRLANAVMLRPGILLLQYEFLTMEDQSERSGASRVRSLEVDLASASVTSLGDSLPVFIPLGQGRNAIRMNTEWPGVEVRVVPVAP